MTTTSAVPTRVDSRGLVEDMRAGVIACYKAAQKGDVRTIKANLRMLARMHNQARSVVAGQVQWHVDKKDPNGHKRGRGIQLDEATQRALDAGLEIYFLFTPPASSTAPEREFVAFESRVYSVEELKLITDQAHAIASRLEDWCRAANWSR